MVLSCVMVIAHVMVLARVMVFACVIVLSCVMVLARVLVLTRVMSPLRGSNGLSARIARKTKSRVPKGLQLEVGAFSFSLTTEVQTPPSQNFHTCGKKTIEIWFLNFCVFHAIIDNLLFSLCRCVLIFSHFEGFKVSSSFFI